MGIVSKTKRYLSARAASAAAAVEDGIAAAASLSPLQLREIEKKRTAYFSGTPDMGGDAAQTLVKRNLGAVSIEVHQAFLERLKTDYLPVNGTVHRLDPYNRIRFFELTKWVSDPQEKNLDKLVNVYQVLSEEDCNIALIYHRTASSCRVTMAVVNTDPDASDPAKVNSFHDRIVAAVRGNFPGVEIHDMDGSGIPPCLQNVIRTKHAIQRVKSVATISNLASEKSENFISQSMEKLLDGIVPTNEDDAYTIVLLAKPITDQLSAKNRLFDLYSYLAPYASWQTNYTCTESNGSSASANAGVNLGLTAGLPIGTGPSVGGNFGANFARSSHVTVQVGKNEGVSRNYTNYGVKYTLDVLEKQLRRLDESSALGMWKFASYVISTSPVTANNVAHMYLALTQGEESYMTRTAVHLWDGEEEKAQAAVILESIQKLQHPVFGLRETADKDRYMYPLLVTPSVDLSGKELARALNLPRKSVSGLPVYECVPFGREVVQYAPHPQCEAVSLGHIYHMRRTGSTPVPLDKNSLTAHTFVTGSTGAGKSNTIYTLLNRLCLDRKEDTKFLVIEPAKGEYKEALGGYPGVQVYGTNPYKTPLLRLNPFSFPEDTHVLEHIDRLVEICNACWPMYAAMPAVLKAAVEQAYKTLGWSLHASTCVGKRTFPTFRDVMKALPSVVDGKGFSNDTQGDYKGALLARLESLTNGINGQVLCACDELTDEALFDRNVIVDLSRVGSSETKALLMGVLILKLQEYRMAQQADGRHSANSGLRHITVLEEAHHLLRRTSAEQHQESSNLQGKSVEMLTNAIAEMRTYGEGFLIADQSPGLLDMAVIRNTNTKIILRLPDESDRLLIGKAAGLNDAQITELARLDTGVAAVYQNHWLESVLCKVDCFDKAKRFSFRPPAFSQDPLSERICQALLHNAPDGTLSEREGVDRIKTWIARQDTGKRAKRYLAQLLLDGTPLSRQEHGYLLYCLAKGKQLADDIRHATVTTEEARAMADQRIMEDLSVSERTAVEIRQVVLFYAADSIRQDEPQWRRLREIGGIM